MTQQPGTPSLGHRATTDEHFNVPTASRPTLSFELFPPRLGPDLSQTWGRIDRLLLTEPDFVSVTYRPRFIQEEDRVWAHRERNDAQVMADYVASKSQVPLMAHLTCIGYTRDDLITIITDFLNQGVRRFLALRGDAPAGVNPVDVVSEVPFASDLVALIREVERDYFADGKKHLTIAVAAYPANISHLEDLDVLASKQEAGADFAITQVFYRQEDYCSLMRASQYVGLSLPILPGVMPLTDIGRLTRLESLTGVAVPDELRSRLTEVRGAERLNRGIDATLNLASALLEAGAPGVHLYTFNRPRPALDVVSHLRLGRILSGSAPDRDTQSWVGHGYLNAMPGGETSIRRSAGRFSSA
ncbi:methylenetetrahydrofolate reductase [Actinomyces vulturis]|uniref:methylenetetrahydrofolate reductase n=1 Tax=Actinomyces vulturis TaxID=1857645 RepID=UPI0009F58CC1|nr:methylenetetrahydrofolate reductase [Actinomyces vulturis]